VHLHNSSADGTAPYGFPFVAVLFPASAGDPAAMGEKSVMIIVALGGILLAFEIVSHIRAIRRRKTQV
jgi:hypothetical protein